MRPEEHSFTARDGRTLTFLFNHRGIIAAEKAGEAGFGDLLAGMAEGRLGYLVSLIWGGLRARHPEIGIEECWDLLDSEGKPLAEALGEALKAAMPGQGGEDRANPRKAGRAESHARSRPAARARGTGTRSSPRGSRKG
jgi:hypothetical protein